MKNRMIAIRHKGQSLDQARLRELWDFRLRFMYLKEWVNPDDDYSHFAEYCRKSQFVYEFRNGGKMVGFFVIFHEPRTWQGTRFIAAEFQYGFFEKEYRRSAVPARAAIRVILEIFIRSRFLPVYFFNAFYLSSYISISGFISRMVTLSDTDITEWERGALMSFIERSCGSRWNRDSLICEMPTKPKITDEEAYAAYRATSSYDKYMRMNPGWKEGNTVIVMIRIKVSDFFSLMRGYNRRKQFKGNSACDPRI